MTDGHPSGWTPDDQRWDDEAATVRFGPGPDRSELVRPRPRPSWRRRRVVRIAATVGPAAAALGVLVITITTGRANDDRPAPSDTVAHDERPARESCPSPPSTAAGDTVGLPVALVGDCIRGVHHDRATAALTIEGWGRFRFGEVDDWLVVADWGCDGHPSPALYRPATGMVYVFTTWPTDTPVTSDHVVDAELVDGVPTVEHHHGCPRLVIDTGT